VHRDLLESYYPTFIGSQQINKAFDVKTNRINTNIMKSEVFASVVLPFEHLDFFCQIGDNVTETTPLYIVCVGRLSTSDEKQVFVQKIECSGPDFHDLSISAVETLRDSVNFLGIAGLSTLDI
jgi:hypothetical protein